MLRVLFETIKIYHAKKWVYYLKESAIYFIFISIEKVKNYQNIFLLYKKNFDLKYEIYCIIDVGSFFLISNVLRYVSLVRKGSNIVLVGARKKRPMMK
jgi:hypothetical protein